MEFIKKNYMSISIVFLSLAVYVILFPFISKLLVLIYPGFGICPYLAMTGKPCPLCGGTRYIANLGQVFKNPQYLLHPFGFIMLFIFFEIAFRIMCILKIRKKKTLNSIIVIDIIVHTIAITSFFIYEILFMINN